VHHHKICVLTEKFFFIGLDLHLPLRRFCHCVSLFSGAAHYSSRALLYGAVQRAHSMVTCCNFLSPAPLTFI
jgi:hypothetical protein